MSRHNFSKIIRNLIILSLPLIILCVWCAHFPMSYLAIEYAMWAEERDYTHTAPAENTALSSPEILIMGDSRAKSSFMPAILSEDSDRQIYNIAIGGTTSVEMYYALSNYLKHHDAPEEVILTFAPYHFCTMDNWQQTLYYNYLTLPELFEVERRVSDIGGDETTRYSGWFADIISFKLRLPNKYLDAVYTAHFTGNYSSNMEKYHSVQKDMGYTEFGTDPGNDRPNYETHHKNFDYSPLVLDYYDRLLSLCRDNNIHVSIIQAPINEASSPLISDDFINGYNSFLSSVKERYPEFTVETDIPVYDNKYFGDNNHLNRSGAEKFSTEFRDKYSELLK